jgi:hypothetical protein
MHLITAWLSLCVILFIPVHFIADRLTPKQEEINIEESKLGVIEVKPMEDGIHFQSIAEDSLD